MANDISKLNQDYESEKKSLDNLTKPGGLKDKITKMEQDLAILTRDFKVNEAELELAKSKNDKAEINRLTTKVASLREDILNKSKQLNKANEFLTKQQTKVNSKLQELTQNPEIKKKLDTILYTKYDRKQKVAMEKKAMLEQIKAIVDAHPTLQSWLKGIEGYEKSINKVNKVISVLSAKNSADLTLEETTKLANAITELPHLKNKLDARRSDLVSYFQKNHPELMKKFDNKNLVEGLHSYANLMRQIQGEEKSIKNYEMAKSNLSINRTTASPKPVATPATIDDNKPSWLHPIKRIKHMINKRRSKSNPVTPTPTTNNPVVEKVNIGKEAYESAIVQAYLKNQEKQGLHDAAKETRKEGR